jgi:AAA+ ATPase superfamily predicted ATPase
MEFYNRAGEIAILREFEKNAQKDAQMTLVMGRRRLGKTTLLRNAFTGKDVLYFFVGKKNEVLLCEEFVNETNEKLGTALGIYTAFTQLFKAIMIQAQTRHLTLIIDEFQEFANINNSVFSDIQNIWDTYKDSAKINLVCCGSIYSMMKRIFENSKEPLFGRATAKLFVNPFELQVVKQILSDFYPDYKNEDLLAFYMITGGVAKYIEQLIVNKAFAKKKILDAIFKNGSFFLNEGKDVLIDEFGKDYGNYFSVLSLIASGKTERTEIESAMNMPVGGFLDRLEKEYSLIKRFRPFGAKEGSRNNKYKIEDNFLNFWFRFIYKYRSAVEIGNFDYVRDIVERDYETYSGLILEKYFRQKLIESKQFSGIGNYWDRKGENEIDIVAVNDLEKLLVFYEVKRNKKRVSLSALKQKAEKIIRDFPDYNAEFQGLSLDDM